MPDDNTPFNRVRNDQPLIEWIPNISTADVTAIGTIRRIFEAIPDLYHLHTDIGPEVNRTVFTLAGTMDSLKEALFSLMEWLAVNIDMSVHSGTHPRLGTLDVSPYVLLKSGNQEELLAWVADLARELSQAYQYPVFLYEKSAKEARRANLADIRRGEYEGLQAKLNDPFWKPDFGSVFNSRLGATVMGLRDFLIAYNVNLDTNDLRIAQTIAESIRSKGPANRPDRLSGVKAIGWYLEPQDICQVSTNITETRWTSPLDIFRKCRELSLRSQVGVTGSELIGLIPYHAVAAMQQATGFSTTRLTDYLGLEYCGITDLKERIIEHKVYLASGKTIFNEIFDSK